MAQYTVATYDVNEELWEEVYNCSNNEPEVIDEGKYKGWTYYQTYGGGPSGGYYIKDDKVVKVHHDHSESTYTPIDCVAVIHGREDVAKGQNRSIIIVEEFDTHCNPQFVGNNGQLRMGHPYKCCITDKVCWGFGNNPYPLKEEGVCCESANMLVVMARMMSFKRK